MIFSGQNAGRVIEPPCWGRSAASVPTADKRLIASLMTTGTPTDPQGAVGRDALDCAWHSGA